MSSGCSSTSLLVVLALSTLSRLVSRLDFPTSGVLPLALGSPKAGSTQFLEAQYAARQAG